jgi:zinc/manganese transport system substrate-binding protein
MVREVGGDDVRVTVVVPPLGDPHTFEPAPRDARALAEAKVLVVNGLGFESWMPRLVQAAGFSGRKIVASQGVRARELDDADTDPHETPVPSDAAVHGGTLDPHAWQDLGNGVIYVRNIAQGLAQADPVHAAGYEARAQAYAARLRAADAQWRAQLAAVPAGRRVLATSHDAFGYFGAAYGIQVLSVVGVSSEAEPSARVMADLVRQIRAHRIRALFLEHGGNSRALEQIAAETGVKPGGELFADTLDVPGREASTYLGMFRWNTGLLLRAFTAP